jgi:hypothetical protein
MHRYQFGQGRGDARLVAGFARVMVLAKSLQRVGIVCCHVTLEVMACAVWPIQAAFVGEGQRCVGMMCAEDVEAEAT